MYALVEALAILKANFLTVKMFVLVCIPQARVCDEVCIIPCHARFVMRIGDAMAWVTSFSLIWLPDYHVLVYYTSVLFILLELPLCFDSQQM